MNWIQHVDAIRGWLISPCEPEMLFRYAQRSQVAIVELGSFEGKSTCCLAAGSLAGNQSPVFAIDHGVGSPEICKLLNVPVIETHETLLENLQKFGYSSIVTVIRSDTSSAAREFQQECDLLFVDSDHRRVEECIRDWLVKVIIGGIVIFHDFTCVPEIADAVHRLITSHQCELIETVGTSVVLRKLQGEPHRHTTSTSGKTAKLLLGGLMLGDTFHGIPELNKLLVSGVTKLIWVTGTYERPAIEFLAQFYPIEAHYFEDGNPSDFAARSRFSAKYKEYFENIEADICIRDVEFSWCSGSFEIDRRWYLLNNIERLITSPEESIILHPQSIHGWKNSKAVECADWSTLPYTLYTVGRPIEYLIPHSIDFRGRTFFEVAQKILASRLVVGTHSAIACLTLYLGKPAIVCHPWKDPNKSAFLHFSDFSSLMFDVYNPPPDVLLNLARKYLTGEKIPPVS